MRQIILDTETTGLDPIKGHRLVEIGCLEMINRRLTGRKFQTYINPEREVDPGAVKITGLTTEFLLDKPKFAEIVSDFIDFLQDGQAELIIHNAPFDLGFLNHELGLIQHAFSPIENYLNVIDTLVLARQMHPGQRNSLDALCKRYNVDNANREYHGALLDADLLTQVYLLMTAGQTDMQFGYETRSRFETREETEGKEDKLNINEEYYNGDVQFKNIKNKFQVKKIKRLNPGSLTVIRATESEIKLHNARLMELQKK